MQKITFFLSLFFYDLHLSFSTSDASIVNYSHFMKIYKQFSTFLFISGGILSPCHPYKDAEPQECSHCHPHLHCSPGMQSVLWEKPVRYCSVCVPGRYRFHPWYECPDVLPVHHPEWNRNQPQSTSSVWGSMLLRRRILPSDLPDHHYSTPEYERVHPGCGRILRCRTTSCCTSPWNPRAYTVLPFPAFRTGVRGTHLSPRFRENLLPYGSKGNRKSW